MMGSPDGRGTVEPGSNGFWTEFWTVAGPPPRELQPSIAITPAKIRKQEIEIRTRLKCEFFIVRSYSFDRKQY